MSTVALVVNSTEITAPATLDALIVNRDAGTLTTGVVRFPYTRALPTSATFVAAATNVRAVPGNPVNGHYI
jgi:hypothetical protein